ncbi:MAG TPA: DUF4271 domain-containing protein [Chitinophagales bacterium]|nr:DUF4271 domain-containing protein [Chitinophagales bacterium]
MSIYFKNICLLLLVYCCSSYVIAQEKEYNPVFVDTFLIQTSQEATLQEITQKNDVSSISSNPLWDVQQLKEKTHLTSLVLITPILIFLLIILKFVFNNFFQSSLLGLFNDKTFQLQYRNKKFSEILPLILIFILRNSTIVLILQFLLSVILKRNQYLSIKTFLFLFLIANVFFAFKLVAEYFVQNVIQSGSIFRVYFTQHYLISLWLTLPFLALILIMYLNSIELTMNLVLLFFMIPFAIISLFSTIRSLMLWNGAWKQYFIYFFIYLCTFKILPYLIIAKFASAIWL